MIILFSIFSFILGCVMASFCGVVVDRIPRGQSIVSPPSRCDECGHELKWYENIPLLSFLIQGGKCRACGKPIGWFFFLSELIGGAGCLIIFLVFGFSWSTVFGFLLLWLFLVMGGIDRFHHEVYDATQWIYLAVSAGFVVYACLALNRTWYDFLIGGAVGFLLFLAIKGIGRVAAKQECLGMGDVIFMGVSGILLGWKSLLLSVLFSSVFGALTELLLLCLHKKERSEEIAFIPYLAFGVMVAFLFGEGLIGWYIRLIT